MRWLVQTELDSFLIEISALILAFKDEDGQPLVNKILDKTGMKGTGVLTLLIPSFWRTPENCSGKLQL